MEGLRPWNIKTRNELKHMKVEDKHLDCFLLRGFTFMVNQLKMKQSKQALNKVQIYKEGWQLLL